MKKRISCYQEISDFFKGKENDFIVNSKEILNKFFYYKKSNIMNSLYRLRKEKKIYTRKIRIKNQRFSIYAKKKYIVDDFYKGETSLQIYNIIKNKYGKKMYLCQIASCMDINFQTIITLAKKIPLKNYIKIEKNKNGTILSISKFRRSTWKKGRH